MRDIPVNTVRAGFSGDFQLEETIIDKSDVPFWQANIGRVVAAKVQLKKNVATWWYVRDVIEVDGIHYAVMVRRDMDAIMDMIGISVGQLGG